ncbi:hypothetical protein EYZ11_003502 [Aspergillus tanneri]|uniref:DUF3074 domain-containing protein n=1 Tax=Aspergillus tanneri TaxID=1220188 RepID=A0A4S3JQ91_9EURO|nr:uncharacterized protein ATNIH1004_008903 [Aspergillus tanneri]KAA8644697.1 hypothetical protein ATNIH1004_008903 [Aspergillus tanneri]THC96998.1 hypothetical protein EYZ11_003502 [Aspergillus tanneri]
MAALQEALESLGPISWDEVPTNPNSLRDYTNDLYTKAQLIVDSVPEPPFNETAHHIPHDSSSSSPSSRVITASTARIGTHDPTLLSLQREWGKPIKNTNPKDNPHDILVHKLPAKDGNGAWFARRSVHAGLSFEKWQEKLSSEMVETLKANQKRVQKGRPPDRSIRGIGAERLVEELVVRDERDRRIGGVNVFHVSAQFPKPTTPRDFVPLILNWDMGMGMGEGEGESRSQGKKTTQGGGGRFWMMASKPCTHPDVPPSQGHIRGLYESVEFIREIPREGAGEDDEDVHVVEWVMVTRSDPGGNIPRWIVEKGTPKSICSDASKFLDWACQETDASSSDVSTKDEPVDAGATQRRRSLDKHDKSLFSAEITEGHESESNESDLSNVEDEHHGLIASFAYLLNAGLERYAPQAVLDYLPLPQHRPSRSTTDNSGSSQGRSPRASSDPTRPAEANHWGEEKHHSDAQSQASQGKASVADSTTSGLAKPLEHGTAAGEIMKTEKKEKLSSHEKQLAKLFERKRKVEAQLDQVRSDIHSLHLPSADESSKRDRASAAALSTVSRDPNSDQLSSSTASSIKKGSEGGAKSVQLQKNPSIHDTARLHKVASGLFSDEAKLVKQLGKIEKDQLKETSKIEARQRKHARLEEKSRSRTETESLRHEVEYLKKEIERLRGERRQWLDLVGTLQAENTRLAAQHS